MQEDLLLPGTRAFITVCSLPPRALISCLGHRILLTMEVDREADIAYSGREVKYPIYR